MLLNSLIRKICAEIVELFFSTIRNDIITIEFSCGFYNVFEPIEKAECKILDAFKDREK